MHLRELTLQIELTRAPWAPAASNRQPTDKLLYGSFLVLVPSLSWQMTWESNLAEKRLVLFSSHGAIAPWWVIDLAGAADTHCVILIHAVPL
jgi:hypothetical protein